MAKQDAIERFENKFGKQAYQLLSYNKRTWEGWRNGRPIPEHVIKHIGHYSALQFMYSFEVENAEAELRMISEHPPEQTHA